MIKIDLDRFKKVNDTLGHAAGDFVLRHVSEILRDNTREDDIVARIGGDEFVVLCSAETSLEDAMECGERLLNEILQPLYYEGKQCVFGASLGVAMRDASTTTPSELLNNSDIALYEAKAAGRGTLEMFSPELRCRMDLERQLSKDFVDALERKEFEPFYQTQHYAGSRALAGVEVLARWRHPTHGLLTPDKFLEVSRQLGMEASVDAAIFDRAVEDVAKLERRNMQIERIAFNVSGGRVIETTFLETAQAALQSRNVRIAFEILESISVEDHGAPFFEAIERLKLKGFEIDIDDFGSYHASINSVIDIKPNGIKIDRSIVRPLGHDPQAERLIYSIAEIGKSLGISVTAEGVETDEQAKIIEQIGCDRMQGYFFSKPMPIDALFTFVSNNKSSAA